MEHELCQSCGMPLTEGITGTNADGSPCREYCIHCYRDGKFVQDFTMSQMMEFCLQFLDQMNMQTGQNLRYVEAKERMLKLFPSLKRWKEKDLQSPQEKAERLLSQCENVTVVSIDSDGYPRPVQMSKIGAASFNEVWMATSAESAKVRDFLKNGKAGLCYDHYGDGVALRGTVQVITDDETRRMMWQDWFIHHFPGGPADPDYVLLHFVGSEATFWIDGEFSRFTL